MAPPIHRNISSEQSFAMKRLLILILAIPLSCGRNEASTTPKKQATQSDEITIRKTFAAIDDESYDELMRYCTRNDERGVSLMIEAGKAIVVPANTKARIVDRGVVTHTVRIEGGPHADKTVLVAVEFVEPR